METETQQSTPKTDPRFHTIEMLLHAEQPIAHHEGTVGNEAMVTREKVFAPDGRQTRVPVLSGNAIRHALRESSTRATLQCAGLLREGHTEEALRLLFAGGQLTKQSGTMKLDSYRDMCAWFPPLAILGGVSGRIIPGQCNVGKAWLLCEETMHIVPAWVHEWVTESERQINPARAHVDRVQYVRMDPMLRPEVRALLSEGEREQVEGRLLRSDTARSSGDEVEAHRSKSTNMPHAFETVAAGSLFFFRLYVRAVSMLQEDTLHVMLATWLQHACVGGKQGTGHGLLRAVECRGLMRREVAPAERDSLAFGVRAPEVERFRAHVENHADDLRDWLNRVRA